MTRSFEDRPAVRERTPLLVGLVGPSGSGKTFSALRLAAGFQLVNGGETFFIDTEARRALHYADRFKFRHLAFGAPFGSLDYLAAIEHCVAKGATTIIVDSMSHEHEGPGGVLEQHDVELKRMGGQMSKSMLAWQKPKSARRRMINGVLQLPCNFIFCFRAKEKMKLEQGKEPVPLGFMPIAGEEFVYEMTLKALLLPGSNGTPCWQSDFPGEKLMIKLPEQFRSLFGTGEVQLTETIGAELAKWAAGVTTEALTADEIVARLDACSDDATVRTLEMAARASWSAIGKDDRSRVTAAMKATKARLAAAASAQSSGTPPNGTPDPERSPLDERGPD